MLIVRHSDGTLVRMDGPKYAYIVKSASPRIDNIICMGEEDCDDECAEWLATLPVANDVTGRYIIVFDELDSPSESSEYLS